MAFEYRPLSPDEAADFQEILDDFQQRFLSEIVPSVKRADIIAKEMFTELGLWPDDIVKRGTVVQSYAIQTAMLIDGLQKGRFKICVYQMNPEDPSQKTLALMKAEALPAEFGFPLVPILIIGVAIAGMIAGNVITNAWIRKEESDLFVQQSQAYCDSLPPNKRAACRAKIDKGMAKDESTGLMTWFKNVLSPIGELASNTLSKALPWILLAFLFSRQTSK